MFHLGTCPIAKKCRVSLRMLVNGSHEQPPDLRAAVLMHLTVV